MRDPIPLLDQLSLRWSCFIICCIALCLSPCFKEDFDVIRCWLTWSIASGGIHPWAIYAKNPDCNYPPFVLYLLAATQSVINLLGLVQTGSLSILLVKLPNLIACVSGCWLCLAGLEPLVGRKSATATALLYLFCAPLWFNAAIWGQWDALSSLAMIACLLATANQRPILAGTALGWAFSIKFHAIILVPAIAIYAFRRWTLSQIGAALLAMIFAWGLIAAPFFIAGQGGALMRSYTGAINFYPGLTEGAFNGWQLVQLCNLVILHQPTAVAGSDVQQIFGLLSARNLGLILFSMYTLWLCIGLARFPTRLNLIVTAGLTAVAFFMLPTQVHQRYLVPAAAILSIVALHGYFKPYLLVAVAALVNQWVVLEFERRVSAGAVSDAVRQDFIRLYCLLSVINLLGFAWITWHHHRRLRLHGHDDFQTGSDICSNHRERLPN